MPKPQARPRRIDVATPPPTPIAAIAIATSCNRRGNAFQYRAVGTNRSWSGTVATSSKESAILDAIAAIRAELAGTARIRFLVSVRATSSLWRYQDEIAGLLPGASIEWPGISNLALMEAAHNALTDLSEEVASGPPDTSPLTVATDGSVRQSYTGSGWLAADGQYGLKGRRHRTYMHGSEPVLVSELRAIVDAVSSLRDRPLTLRSDSKSAIEMATNWMRGCDGIPHRCQRFHAKGVLTDLVIGQQMMYAERERLTLVWARGHQGEPLNEGADALARLARRRAAHPNDLTPDEYEQRAFNLAEAFAGEYNRSIRKGLAVNG